MPKSKVRYVGLDVHKDSIVIAVAEQGRSASREVGTVPGDWRSLEKRLVRLDDTHRSAGTADGELSIIVTQPLGRSIARR